MIVYLSGLVTVSCSITIEVDDNLSDNEIISLVSGSEDLIFENEAALRFPQANYGQWIIGKDGIPHMITIDEKDIHE